MTIRSLPLVASLLALALPMTARASDEGTPMDRLNAACGKDIQDFCANNVEQDMTHILMCLGAHKDQLSDECVKYHAAAHARVKLMQPKPQMNQPQSQ